MKPQTYPKPSSLLTAVSLAGMIGIGALQTADAFLIAYEPFDYAADGSSLLGANGGAGFTGAWRGRTTDANVPVGSFTATSGSLAHPSASLPTLGNSATITGEFGTAEPMRDFAAQSGTGTLWFSFLGQRQGATEPTNVDNPYPRGVTESLFGGGAEKTGVGNSSGAALNEWSVIPLGSGGNRVGSGDPYNVLQWAVLRIDYTEGGTSDQYLWLSPDPGVEPLVGAADVTILGAADASGIDAFRPFVGNTGTARPFGVLAIDEVRLGTTYADMSAVPEPSVALLGGLGLLGLLRRRRD